MSGALLHHARWWRAAMLAVLCSATTLVSAEKYTRDIIREVHQPPPYKWTKFVQVEGQPEPVPIEWVSTPEGRFAHSIKIPNPIPKDSGYRWWMSSKDYFLRLCEKEAGEFIFKRADNVEGLLFMRPPERPSDYDLMDRNKLEAPLFEATFQSLRADLAERGALFVAPPHQRFTYVEEPNGTMYNRASAYAPRPPRLTKIETVT